LVFFNQNHSWAQPAFYVHQMIADTWQPLGVAVNVSCASGGQTAAAQQQLSVSAQRSALGGTAAAATVVLRISNQGAQDVKLTLSAHGLLGGDRPRAAALAPQAMTVLQAPPGGGGLLAVNSGRRPELVKPRTVALSGGRGASSGGGGGSAGGGGAPVVVDIPAQSFAVVVAMADALPGHGHGGGGGGGGGASSSPNSGAPSASPPPPPQFCAAAAPRGALPPALEFPLSSFKVQLPSTCKRGGGAAAAASKQGVCEAMLATNRSFLSPHFYVDPASRRMVRY
jgi:hypothetical protein